MKIDQWELARITPYPGNLRQDDAAVDGVAESIRQFGFRQPLRPKRTPDRAGVRRREEDGLSRRG